MIRLPGKPVFILFKQVTEAIVRNAQNESADADSGGGARDLRLGPYDFIHPFMKQMFPLIRRGDERPIRWTKVTWGNGNRVQELEYWPPTNARPNEGRIAKISSLPPLAEGTDDVKDTVILFVQDEYEVVWVRYASKTGLRKSCPEVGRLILQCLEKAGPRRTPTGFIDLRENGFGRWCNTEDES